ncbi:hypothetical protein SAMN05428977_104026 [Nitrosomonas sp. Nm166]|nr:hypothetical protein SAMN05428977_104026 [Nitrosomonas sp. Nm166]
MYGNKNFEHMTAGTHLFLVRNWFWAIYRVASDKGGIFCITLHHLCPGKLMIVDDCQPKMLRKIRIAMEP